MDDEGLPDEANGGTVVGIIAANLCFHVGVHVRDHNLGVALSSSAEYRFVPGNDQIHRPRMSFVRRERFPSDRVPNEPLRFAPDLAIEIVFPDDTAEKVEAKLAEYLRAGVRRTWVVYISTRNVWAYRPDGTARLYRVTDTLLGEDVLPGFAVPVAALFENV